MVSTCMVLYMMSYGQRYTRPSVSVRFNLLRYTTKWWFGRIYSPMLGKKMTSERIGRVVVYYALAAHSFSAVIKCLHCRLDLTYVGLDRGRCCRALTRGHHPHSLALHAWEVRTVVFCSEFLRHTTRCNPARPATRARNHPL